jgi:hypothetical protein
MAISWDLRGRKGSRDPCLSLPILNEPRLLYFRVRLPHSTALQRPLTFLEYIYRSPCPLKVILAVKRAFPIVKTEIPDAIKH